MDPNGGTLYKDAGCTTAATVDGDIILGNKDGLTANVAGKIGGRNALLKISGGLKWLRTDNAAIGSNSAGAALKWTTGTLDPAGSTVFICYKPDRRCNIVDDIIADIGNSAGVSANVSQIVHDAGNIKSYNGAAAFGGNGFPFVSPDKDAEVYCVRSDLTNGVRLFRADTVDSSGVIRNIGLGRTLTSNASLGWTLGGRNAADNFAQANWYLAVAFNGLMTDAEVYAEITNIKSYLTGLGMVFTPGGSAPKLIVDGDSNSTGTGASQVSTEWGTLLQNGVIAAGIAGLAYESFGASSRTFVETAGIEKSIIAAANATTGKVVYVCHCGENDAKVSSDTTIWNNAKAHFQALRAGVSIPSNFKIVWLGIPGRGDIGGASLTSYDTCRANLRATMLADPTMGGVLDAYVDITGDSVLGASGGLNTTYFSGDKVHYKDAGQTRVYNGTDGTGQTLLNAVLPLFATDSVPPVVSAAAVASGGTSIVIDYMEATSPPVLPGVGGADVTGFSVTVGGNAVSVLAARATGAKQHTVYLGAPVFTGQAVQLSYSSVSGNVTDSAAPAGQTMVTFSNLAVTNNSAQTGGGAVFTGVGGGHLVPFGSRRGR
jgi:hypothetical protein